MVSQCSKNKLGLTHVVTQVLGFQSLHILMLLDGNASPFLMDDIGQNSILVLFGNFMPFPVIGELIHHHFLP